MLNLKNHQYLLEYLVESYVKEVNFSGISSILNTSTIRGTLQQYEHEVSIKPLHLLYINPIGSKGTPISVYHSFKYLDYNYLVDLRQQLNIT